MATFVRPTHEEVVEMIRRARQRKQEWIEDVHRRWDEMDRELLHEDMLLA